MYLAHQYLLRKTVTKEVNLISYVSLMGNAFGNISAQMYLILANPPFRNSANLRIA